MAEVTDGLEIGITDRITRSLSLLNGLADEGSRLLSSRLTLSIAGLRGESSSQLACIGYPKSGTSWLAKLLSTVLGVPEPAFYRLPVLRPAILHGHRYTSHRLPTVYIVRDPRDVMTSLYFHRSRSIASNSNPRFRSNMQKRYQDFPAPLKRENFEANIHAFVELELAEPRDIRVPWSDHVEWALRAASSRPNNFIAITYERLVEDTLATLSSVFEGIDSVGMVSVEELRSARDKNSFTTLSGGRAQGELDSSSFYRSGEPGSWRRDLPKETADLIASSCRSQMMRFGYLA